MTPSDGSAHLSPLFTWRSAVCESDLGSTTRHVLLTLSLHMNERGGSCFPSTRTLATETGLSRRTVEKHLRRAHEAGWIRKEQSGRKADGTYKRAEYIATVPGEAASPGPGESDAGPGESDDISQGKQLPHRTSVQRGRHGGRSGRTPARGNGRPSGPGDVTLSGEECPDCGEELRVRAGGRYCVQCADWKQPVLGETP